MMKRRLCLVFTALLAIAACGDSTEPLVPTTLELDRQSVQLTVPDTARVTATVRDQHGSAFPEVPDGYSVGWSASNPSVASVDGGVITAVGPGTTTVTATSGNLEPVHVSVEVTQVFPLLSGDIGFDYSGHSTGSFAVDHSFRLDPNEWPENWVVTFHDPDYGSHDIMAERRRSDGLFDFAWFWVEGEVTQPGSHDAWEGVLVLGWPADGPPEAVYDSITSGAVEFTSVSETRMAGTFQFTIEDEDANVLEVTGGTFDAPLVVVAPGDVVPAPPAAAAASRARSAKWWRSPSR